MKIVTALLAIILPTLLVNSCSSELSAQQSSKYAGEETRDIKSLSAEDIKELRSGGGWGFAKAAELNGYPGPSHVLEMKNEIGLSASQETQIRDLFDEMKKQAVPLGDRLVELERELDRSFAEGTVDRENLKDVLERIGRVRSELRFVHLSAHLRTPEILTKDQIAGYNKIRGYGSADPCKKVPEGHDPEMWKKHNGCDPE